jgi:transcriptional regulator NrdR family protein
MEKACQAGRRLFAHMDCPICRSAENKVLRTSERGGNAILRRRECLQCRHRFTTFETVEDTAMQLAELKQRLAPLAEYIEPVE